MSLPDMVPPHFKTKPLLARHLDLWEHACLLFHSYEWTSAAEAFTYLASVLSETDQSMRCYINAGLIHARLGDLEEAQVALLLAREKNKECALVHFLLGLVAAELGIYLDTVENFERCGKLLSDGDVVNYSKAGLEFKLRPETVADNVHKVRAHVDAQEAFRDIELLPPCLHGVPAEVVFEAPPREGGELRSGANAAWSPASATSYRSDLWRAAREPAAGAPEIDSATSVTSSPRNSSMTSRGALTVRPFNLGRLDGSIASHEAPAATPRQSVLERSILGRLTPRHATPSRSSLQPREEFDYRATRELASFIRHTGPSTSRRKAFDVDKGYMMDLIQRTGPSSRPASLTDLEDLPAANLRPSARRSASDALSSVLGYYTGEKAVSKRRSVPEMSQLTRVGSWFKNPRTAPPPLKAKKAPPTSPDPAVGFIMPGKLELFNLRRRITGTAPSTVSSIEIFRMGLQDAESRGWQGGK